MKVAGVRVLWASVIAGSILCVIACSLIATQSLILGSSSAGWFYGYQQPFSVRYLAVFLLIAAPAAALLFLPAPRPGLHEWVLILLCLAVAGWAQWLLRSVAPYTLESLFTSNGASSFYGFAQQQRWLDVLGHFGRATRGAPLHAQGNMPGKVTLVYAFELVTSNPNGLAWLVVAASSIGGLLMYVFVRGLFQDRRTALFSAILYWFHPARLFFLPIMNTVTPTIVLGCACLLVWWLRTGRTAAALLLGVALYVMVFFEPLPLVIGLLFAALSWRSVATGEIPGQRYVVQAGLVLLVFIGTSEAVFAASGFELQQAMRLTAAHAMAFNLTAARPYGFWVLENPFEFFFGSGLCQSVVFVGVMVDELWSGDMLLRERLMRPIVALCVGLLAVVIAVDVIGINRGEVVRLWIFLGSFLQIPAAYACAKRPGRGAIATVLICSLLQATLGTAMIGFVVP
jgi:hypothetical protein